MNTFQKIIDFLEKILLALGLLCFGGLVFVVLLQIITRLWLPLTISWTEEFSRFFFIYSISFCAPVALKNRELVFVDILVLNFPAHIQVMFLILGDILISLLCLVIFSTTFDYFKLGVGQIAPASGWPMTIPYASMCILFTFLSLFSISNWVKHIPYLLKGAKI